jgi:hypothetical protein
MLSDKNSEISLQYVVGQEFGNKFTICVSDKNSEISLQYVVGQDFGNTCTRTAFYNML